MAKKKRYTERYEVLLTPSQREHLDPELIRWVADNHSLILYLIGGIQDILGKNITAEVGLETTKNEIRIWKKSEA